MTMQEQYTDGIRQTQQVWSGMVDSFTGNVQKVLGQTARPFGSVDPSAAIDQLFDFWEKTLEAQREVAKQIVGVTVTAGDRVRTQAETVGTAVRQESETAKQAVRDEAEAAERAARQQAKAEERSAREKAAKKYDELTKAELQEKLVSRDLPKTGNVDKLRERLVADDQK